MKKVFVKNFEKIKRQIGFCGIWCGSCVAGNGTLRNMTSRYRNLIESYSLKEWAATAFDYEAFLKGLILIQKIPLCDGCLKDGGRENCELRQCARQRKITGCVNCPDFVVCKHRDLLQKMRTGAQTAGLFVAPEKIDGQQLIETWTAELKRRWPSCILFLP